MNLLLDTHILLWLLADPERLSNKATTAILQADKNVGYAVRTFLQHHCFEAVEGTHSVPYIIVAGAKI